MGAILRDERERPRRRSELTPYSKSLATPSLTLETFAMEVQQAGGPLANEICWSEENRNESHSSHCVRQSSSELEDGRSFATKDAICWRGSGAHGVCAD